MKLENPGGNDKNNENSETPEKLMKQEKMGIDITRNRKIEIARNSNKMQGMDRGKYKCTATKCKWKIQEEMTKIMKTQKHQKS